MRAIRHGALVVVLWTLVGAPAARAAETSAVASRMNAAHSGTLDSPSPAPPLRQRWTRELDSPETLYPELSYPLIVDGRVFIVAARTLYALSVQTGATLWSTPLTVARLAYDQGRVIATTGSSVRAFDAVTGQPLWTRELEMGDCAAVAADGVVYTKSGWTAYALRGSDGATLWTRALDWGGICEATVGPTLVYYSAGEATKALRRSDGSVAWMFDARGSSYTLALHGGRLWHRDTHYSPALDAATGALAGGAFTSRMPAFAGDLAFISVGYNTSEPEARMLQGVDAATGAVRWEFGAERGIYTTPTVAGGTVYVADMQRGLYGLRASDGRLQWCTTMPDFPDRETHVVAGEGLLLVAAGNSLTVYEPGGAPGCDYKRVARWGWYDPIEAPTATAAREAFESDSGQLPPGVRFAATAPGHQLQVMGSGARVITAGGELDIRPVRPTGPRWTRGEQRQAGIVNLIGAREQHAAHPALHAGPPARDVARHRPRIPALRVRPRIRRRGAPRRRPPQGADRARRRDRPAARRRRRARRAGRVGDRATGAARRLPGPAPAPRPLRPAPGWHDRASPCAAATRAGAWSSTRSWACRDTSAAGCTTR